MNRILFTLLWICCLHLGQAQNNWSSEGSLGSTSERRHRGVGFSIGDKGYVGTGTRGSFGNTGYRELKDFWEYDPITKVWTQLADLAGLSRYDAVGFSIGNKGYIGSGTHLSPSSGDVYLEDFWEYDKSSNSWIYIGDILGGPRFGAVAFTIGAKAYVATGWSPSSGHTTDVFEFDPLNSYTWTQKSSLPGVPRTYAAGFAICDKGYIGTGLIANNTGTADFWEYNPVTNAWTSKPNYGGGACYGAKGFSICTKGFMLKGAQNGTCDSKKFWEFDPEMNTWIQRTDIPGEFRFHPVAFTIKNKGYVGTGKKCGEETYFTDFLSYTPVNAETPDQPDPISGNDNICQGTTEIYSINPISCAESYIWTIPSGSMIINGQGTTSISVDFGNANSGNISVSAVNGCGMSLPSALAIAINPYPTITTSGSTTICSGQSAPIGATGANSFIWSPSTGLSNSSISNPIASPIVSTSYTVIGSTNGCADTSNVVIIVNQTPVITTQGDANICEGSSTSISATGAENYQWFPTAGLSDPSSSIPVASPISTTLYTVIGTTNGCMDTSAVMIFVRPTPDQPDTIYGSLSVCQNTPQTYFISAIPEASNYLWTLPGWPGSSFDTVITTIAFTSGFISVSAVSNGCESLPDSIYISVSTIPSPPDSILGSTSLCGLISNSFSVSPVIGATGYNWTLPLGWSTPSMANAITVQPGESGQIGVATFNQCGVSSPIFLSVNVNDSLPSQPTLFEGDLTPCVQSNIEYELINDGGVLYYSWSLPSGWVGESTSNLIEANVGSASGNIMVIAANACGQSTPLLIPVVPVNIDTSITINGTELVANQQNATYQWMNCMSGEPIQGATAQTFTPSENGEYQVVISLLDCISYSSCMPFMLTSTTDAKGYGITVFPNPSTGMFQIRSNDSGIQEFCIYDMVGQRIPFKSIEQNSGIDVYLDHVDSGTYLLVFNSGDHIYHTHLVKL